METSSSLTAKGGRRWGRGGEAEWGREGLEIVVNQLSIKNSPLPCLRPASYVFTLKSKSGKSQGLDVQISETPKEQAKRVGF